jgi:hypothetical protein
METKVQETLPTMRDANLDRWLGRREAFGLIAGRCSAADVECLREIREKQLYLKVAKNWDEFCRVQLRSSRHRIDGAIRQLEKYGHPFFHATQMMRITETEYIAIKPHMSEEGVNFEGEVIPWGTQHTERLAEAIGKLRAIAAPKPARTPRGFDQLLERIEALNVFLDKNDPLDDRQRRALGDALLRLSNHASRRGIVLVQR